MVSIDSCKLRFDIKDVEIVNTELLKYWGEVAVSDDGELEIGEEDFKRKRFTVKEFGITTSYLVQKKKISGGEVVESLIILMNAKLLRNQYPDGINENNLDLLYQEILKQRVVRLPFEKFLLGALTDCDIKKDFPVRDLEAQGQIVKVLRHLTKSSTQKSRGYDSRMTANNIGIQWSKREVATDACSHVKVYAKDIELKYNSNIFACEFLPEQIPPTMRMECTIKNRKHFRYLIGSESEFQQFTLTDLLSLKQPEREALMSRMMLQHVESDRMGQKSLTSSPTLSEVLAICLLNTLKSLQLAIVKVNQWSSSKSQAYKGRKILKECWKKYIESEVKEKGSSVDEILEFIYNPQGVILDKPEDEL